jgi:hypothetical protein
MTSCPRCNREAENYAIVGAIAQRGDRVAFTWAAAPLCPGCGTVASPADPWPKPVARRRSTHRHFR